MTNSRATINTYFKPVAGQPDGAAFMVDSVDGTLTAVNEHGSGQSIGDAFTGRTLEGYFALCENDFDYWQLKKGGAVIFEGNGFPSDEAVHVSITPMPPIVIEKGMTLNAMTNAT